MKKENNHSPKASKSNALNRKKLDVMPLPLDTYNLSSKRMELYRKMCKIAPNFKWGLLFEEIQNQDNEAVRLLKEEVERSISGQDLIILMREINQIFGDKLT